MFARTRSLALATLIATTSATAQDLTVDVVRDPGANLAVYTATVSAPPGSSFWLYAAPGILGVPLSIPGIFNPLELDPTRLLQLSGSTTVDQYGKGAYSFSLPLDLLENFEIPFQAVVLDPNRNLAFSPLATAVHGDEVGIGLRNMAWVGGFERRGATYRMQFHSAKPGDQIELKINAGQKAVARGIAGPNGQLELRLQSQLQRGDTISIWVNGKLVKSWRYC